MSTRSLRSGQAPQVRGEHAVKRRVEAGLGITMPQAPVASGDFSKLA
jgi:hypothetical protein